MPAAKKSKLNDDVDRKVKLLTEYTECIARKESYFGARKNDSLSVFWRRLQLQKGASMGILPCGKNMKMDNPKHTCYANDTHLFEPNDNISHAPKGVYWHKLKLVRAGLTRPWNWGFMNCFKEGEREKKGKFLLKGYQPFGEDRGNCAACCFALSWYEAIEGKEKLVKFYADPRNDERTLAKWLLSKDITK